MILEKSKDSAIDPYEQMWAHRLCDKNVYWYLKKSLNESWKLWIVEILYKSAIKSHFLQGQINQKSDFLLQIVLQRVPHRFSLTGKVEYVEILQNGQHIQSVFKGMNDDPPFKLENFIRCQKYFRWLSPSGAKVTWNHL